MVCSRRAPDEGRHLSRLLHYFSGKRSRRSQAVLCCYTRVEPDVALPRLNPLGRPPPRPLAVRNENPAPPAGFFFANR